MKRLITFTAIFTVVCCVSCKPKPPETPEPKPNDSIVNTPPKQYVVGEYYNKNGVQGIVYAVNAQDSTKGMIVSLDETECVWVKDVQDSTVAKFQTGATDVDDGVKNMAKIKEIGIAEYPAFDWCDKKTGGGWYLPAQNELWNLALVCLQIQDSLEVYGTKINSTAEYWSSTQTTVTSGVGVGNAHVIKFNGGGKPNYVSVYKGATYKVRAIRAF